MRKGKNRSPAATPFPFLSLPPELRNIVYRYVVIDIYGITLMPHYKPQARHVESPILTSLLRANKQISDEASSILYNENHFFVVVHPDKLLPFQLLGTSIRSTNAYHGIPPPPTQFGTMFENTFRKIRTMTLYVEFKKYENAKTTTRLFREVTKVLLREDGGALKHLKITVRRLGPEYIKGVQEDVKGAEAAREALEPLRQLKNIELSVTAQEERYRGGACLLVEEVGEAWVAALKKEVAAKTPESLT